LLQNLDLAMLDYPLPGTDRAIVNHHARAHLERLLGFLRDLLPSWADNVSRTYFGHARTYPISIDG
jgi:hypothetical protein